MRLRSLAGAALMAMLVAGSVQMVDTYYDDTHYSLTYFIARSCGYTPMQAWRVASANVGVDYSALTEPVQDGRVQPWATDSAQVPRVRFHAMWDYQLGTDASLAPTLISTRKSELSTLGDSQRNPGVLLHYIQDEPPHAGYSSWGGHWFPSNSDEQNRSMNRPFGAMTDFLSSDQKNALSMVDATIATLTKFRRQMAPRQRSGLTCNTAAILPVLSALVKENPVSDTAKVYRELVAQRLEEIRTPTGSTPTSFATLLVAAHGAKLAVPQVSRSDAVVAAALRDLAQYRYKPFNERLSYSYDVNGRTSQADVFTLYGTLNATVVGAGARKVGVSVWAAPTRIGDKPYQLTECKDSGYRFDNLPVGDLIVQSVVDGKVSRKNVRLERSEQGLRLDIAAAKKEEPSDKCNKEAAEMAAQVCGMQENAAGDVDQPRPLEDRFEQKLDECKQEEEKRNTEQQEAANQTPTPTTPVNSGSGTSIGKIVGWTAILGGSLVGGLYVASELAAISELDTTGSSNTTTPTNNNRAPVTNRPSTIGLGLFNCSVANDTSGFRNCTGTVNIRAGTLLAARQGTTISVVTTPSFFTATFIAPGLGGTTGTVSLRATMPRTCAVQTFVSFFVPGTNTAFESIDQMISVSCP